MTAKYLLPCGCGRKLRVSTTQAGEEVPCTCGKILTVPNLSELSSLELAPSKSASRSGRKRPWTRRQGWILLGGIIAAVAIGISVFLSVTRPRLADVETLRPIYVWALWQDLRRGPDRNLSPSEQHFLELLGIRRVWQTALVVAAVGGVILMAAAYAMPAPQKSQRAGSGSSDPQLDARESDANPPRSEGRPRV